MGSLVQVLALWHTTPGNSTKTSCQEPDDELVSSMAPPLQGVAKGYKPLLDAVMSFVHGVNYGRDRKYTKVELRALTPNDVVRWMNLKTFGIPDPPIDSNPMFARSNTLAFWKKAISFFMPDRLVSWVSGCNEGNPTRSIDVNNLIRRVKKRKYESRVLSPRPSVH